jgi:hypothetical protein
MPDRPPRKSDRSACLFVVSQEPPPTELIEWPEDEAEAAALMAECRKIGDEYRALLAAGHDEDRWQEATTKMMTAKCEYLKVHADAVRKVGDRLVYSDGYRRFMVALALGPGEGMTLAELAWATGVPAKILSEWLEASP